eukprot:CAMPEP_0184663380 /NCGR_PEP_ID=MMETSP0308-20130426/47945_1 /TAXON_ID=38269 /ORGANISM="Gloeochaete witrockiana, Strain SAG 46.84" /LENGTH=82 /DNA_ID=CAMNT_0027106087 /DNA_START=30 /DNA_END=278 /DNA_ORIENTATION=-
MTREDFKSELYVPRKCSFSNRLITSKDHASVQLNFVDVDDNGVALNTNTSFAICGFLRANAKSDQAVNALAQDEGLLRKVVG